MFRIYYDDLQEGIWFQGLHTDFASAELFPITGANELNPKLEKVLSQDRPDIILCENDDPILVIERTIEVPSGHNVGQRFARKVAAAEALIPVVYIFPYAARKHGGITEGPRYLNLRLIRALEWVAKHNNTAVTTINWPVDENFEVIQNPRKDERIKEYLKKFLAAYCSGGLEMARETIIKSLFQNEQEEELNKFINRYISIRQQNKYEIPPNSVRIESLSEYASSMNYDIDDLKNFDQVVAYSIGMRAIRSDPYTGMAMLYRYLYIVGSDIHRRCLILEFPEITIAEWQTESTSRRGSKHIRLYKKVADGIKFKDGFLSKDNL